jgi:hypothetical protein
MLGAYPLFSDVTSRVRVGICCFEIEIDAMRTRVSADAGRSGRLVWYVCSNGEESSLELGGHILYMSFVEVAREGDLHDQVEGVDVRMIRSE